ncbi:hypothetical protein BS78_05G204300 [Paspalum vaginatum]|nr:hypothetical protein BS78_05G204300 [Paspalum vaginatum]
MTCGRRARRLGTLSSSHALSLEQLLTRICLHVGPCPPSNSSALLILRLRLRRGKKWIGGAGTVAAPQEAAAGSRQPEMPERGPGVRLRRRPRPPPRTRYIIVIEDLWDELSWTTIKCALVDNNLGSKVIITTRNSDVAKVSCSPIDGAMYELEPLSFKNSKILFYQRIFKEEQEIHSELEEISTKILKKCGGLPLAIITIASRLAGLPNKTKYEWHRVCTSMGSGLEKDKSLENMQEILSLSYGDLPSYLKPCLLYLSMFPEDWEVREDTLVQMWVAEGLVDEEKGENLYELGRRYFNELVNRSMIQPANVDELGSVRACRVHDMILDLLISLSAQENFVTMSQGPQLTPQACKIRRLSLQCDDEQRKIQEHEDDRQAMLALGGQLETELLGEIGKLQLLRTLDLREAYIHEVPASIVQLTKLEHLYVPMGVKLPDGIGNLRSLRELSRLNAVHSPKTLDEIGNLTELRVLSVYNLDDSGLKTFVQRMPNLGNLRSLTIEFNINDEMSFLECMSNRWKGPACLQRFESHFTFIPQLPRWFCSLSELSYLTIAVERLRQDDLQLLGALPMLHFLCLRAGCAGDTNERRFLIGAYQQHFHSLAKFVFWQDEIFTMFAQGAMPKLQSLELYFKLRDFEAQETAVSRDIGLENLTSLKHAIIKLDCYDARNIREVLEDVEAMIRDAISMHPCHPTLELLRFIGESWVSEQQSSGSLDSRDDGGDS